MAAATEVRDTIPDIVIDVTGTNVDAGAVDYTVDRAQARFEGGFSIVTGTLTAMDVIVLGFNKSGVAKDMTNDLFGVATLSSNTVYVADVKLPLKGVIIRYTRSNAVNAVAFTALFAKR